MRSFNFKAIIVWFIKLKFFGWSFLDWRPLLAHLLFSSELRYFSFWFAVEKISVGELFFDMWKFLSIRDCFYFQNSDSIDYLAIFKRKKLLQWLDISKELVVEIMVKNIWEVKI